MPLTDQEKEQLKAMIDRGEKLPPKFKSVLFENVPEVELVWAGKTSEVTNVVLPFQSIEQIDEPREEAGAKGYGTSMLSLIDPASGRQQSGWANKLIWGDNKLVLSSLKNGPLREEIEKAGGLKLVYIDPPFDVGADFSFDVEVGDESVTKDPNIIEELAYRDTWGKGVDSYLTMLCERLRLIAGLLSTDGSILVHCDWRVNSTVRLILDEIFNERMRNEVIWYYRRYTAVSNSFQKLHDTILWYSKSDKYIFNDQREPYTETAGEKDSHYKKGDDGRWYRWQKRAGKEPYKVYLNEEGKRVGDVWQIQHINAKRT